MKKLALLLLFILPLIANAQKEANNWFFGIKAGIHFSDAGAVSILSGSQMETNEGCSSISDTNGNLLFYTDGRSVWDRNHILMPNGDYFNGTGLLGDPSSTHSAIIVPNRVNPNIYYIFTVDEPHHLNASAWPNQYTGDYPLGNGIPPGTIPDDDDGYNNGLNYSIVDLSITGTNGSTGDITTRNVPLQTYDPTIDEEAKYKCSEKVTAVKNNTGTGYWVITQFIDKFYSFFVDASGVNATPVITQITPLVPTSGYRRNAIGCIKISPNGKKIAIAHAQMGTETGGSADNGAVYLYDFDNATGIVSNPIIVTENTAPYGLEFSPLSKKLYVSYDSDNGYSGVHQYDLTAADVTASDVTLATPASGSGAMQLGPNGKIYRAVNGRAFLDVINNPEEDGIACNFQANAVPLEQGTQAVFGLPPFITSFFLATINITHTCLGDTTQFELTVSDTFSTISWDFGDGSPAVTGVTAPTHQYAAIGTYQASVTINRPGEVPVTSFKSVTINPMPVANSITDIQPLCDDDNDGVVTFDFTNSTSEILGTQSSTDYQVSYYETQADADAATNPISSTAYNNISNPQTIYARIQNAVNTNCYLTTTFNISTNPTPDIDVTDEAIVCSNTKAFISIDAGTASAAYSYKWSTGATTPSIFVNTPGIYTVTVANKITGCDKVRTVTVVPSDVATIDDVIIEDLRENNTVTVMASATNNVNTTYQYSLDDPDGPYQDSNFFENVTPGKHTVYVYDTKGCGVIKEEISVLYVPNFFTPNGDNEHETWDVVGINAEFYKNSKIYVFDRYGKLIANVNPQGAGWDGTYNGRKMPSTDYWYLIEMDNGRVIKGHFSMIR